MIAVISHAAINYALLAAANNNRPKDDSIIATVSAPTAGDWLPLLNHKLKKT